MAKDLDTFLVALYSKIDDLYQHYIAPTKPHRPGQKAELSDSEVLTLLICAQCLGWSERRLVNHVQEHWRGFFPHMLTQSAFNRRGRDLAGVMARLVPLLAEAIAAECEEKHLDLEAYQALDGLPIPLLRRCRGEKHLCFASEAGVGHGGSDREWFYGCRLLIATKADGTISGFVVGPAPTGERWLAEALFCWRSNPQAQPASPADLPPPHPRAGDPHVYVGPTGPIWPRQGVGQPSNGPYLTDRGFTGRMWNSHWAIDHQAHVLPPPTLGGEDAKGARKSHSRLRQIVETVNGHLKANFHISFPGARTLWGLMSRISSKLAALNFGIWLNQLLGRRKLAFATLFRF